MTHLTADRVADELTRTAALLAAHGADTTRRVHDLALGASGTGGPGQRNAISDPTGTAATNEPVRLAGLEQRWHKALRNLATEASTLDVISNHPQTHAHALASWCRRGRIGNLNRKPDPADLEHFHAISLEIDHIIYACVPIDRERAQEELREREYQKHRADDCRACGVPIDKPENRKLGMYDQWCYKRIPQWQRANPGLPIDDHHAAFCQYIRERIAQRMIGFDRPASIHSPIGKMTIPEDVA